MCGWHEQCHERAYCPAAYSPRYCRATDFAAAAVCGFAALADGLAAGLLAALVAAGPDDKLLLEQAATASVPAARIAAVSLCVCKSPPSSLNGYLV